jgi:phosphotransferase system HPr (HPr) family protein
MERRTTLENGTETNEPVVRRVTVLNPPGLHARPASVLAARAREFSADIELVLIDAGTGRGSEVGTRVDAKSILDIIVLGAAQGAQLDVIAVGTDAQAAAQALEQLFSASFGMA